MLIIREEQLEKLSESVRDSFIEHMSAHLRNRFPQQCAARELRNTDLRSLVSKAITDAARYGITNEPDVRAFIEYLMLLRPDIVSLEQVPWAGEILRRADLDGTTKIDLIHDHLVFAPATKA